MNCFQNISGLDRKLIVEPIEKVNVFTYMTSNRQKKGSWLNGKEWMGVLDHSVTFNTAFIC